MYYNRDAFEEAGLDPEQPPQTWEELAEYATQITESGAANCGFTTSWPSWVMLENFSAMHNSPLGTLENGFGGMETELNFNNELVARQRSARVDGVAGDVHDDGGGPADR